MISGRLKHSIRIEEPTTDRSTSGQAVQIWTTYANTRADIYPVSGREWFEAHQVNAKVTVKIVMRYIGGLRSDMRVKNGDQYYNIVAILNQENPRRPTMLMCERVNDRPS